MNEYAQQRINIEDKCILFHFFKIVEIKSNTSTAIYSNLHSIYTPPLSLTF